MSKRTGLLQAAEKIVNGAREEDYGHPKDNIAYIADLWSTYKDIEFTPYDVINMMIILKTSRGNQYDTYLDIAGYASLAAEFIEDDA